MLVQAECNEACFNCRGAAEYVPKLGTMLVQAECNEACFNCRGAAEYVPKLGTKVQKNLHHSSSDGDFLMLNIVTSFIYRELHPLDLRHKIKESRDSVVKVKS